MFTTRNTDAAVGFSIGTFGFFLVGMLSSVFAYFLPAFSVGSTSLFLVVTGGCMFFAGMLARIAEKNYLVTAPTGLLWYVALVVRAGMHVVVTLSSVWVVGSVFFILQDHAEMGFTEHAVAHAQYMFTAFFASYGFWRTVSSR